MTQPLLPKLARIVEARLGPEDHGVLTAMLTLQYDDGGMQGAGGYDLRHGNAAARFIEGVLRVCNVLEWSKIPNHMIYALIEGQGLHAPVRGIKQLGMDGDRTFLFADIYEKESV